MGRKERKDVCVVVCKVVTRAPSMQVHSGGERADNVCFFVHDFLCNKREAETIKDNNRQIEQAKGNTLNKQADPPARVFT